MDKYRNLRMTRAFTIFPLAFIILVAALLYIGTGIGHGIIYILGYGLFLLGSWACFIVVITGIAFAHKAINEDEIDAARGYRILGFVELAICTVSMIISVYMISHGFLS
jgi:hypothetical protein